MNGRLDKPSPLRLTWDAAMSLRESIPISWETPAAPLSPLCRFPTWSRPGRCRRGQQSNVHLRWGTDRPMDRLAESLPARTAVPQYRSLGPRRRSRWATPPGRNFPFPTTDRPHVPPPQPIGHGRPDQRPRGRPRPSHQSPLPRHPDRWDQRPRVRR